MLFMNTSILLYNIYFWNLFMHYNIFITNTHVISCITNTNMTFSEAMEGVEDKELVLLYNIFS